MNQVVSPSVSYSPIESPSIKLQFREAFSIIHLLDLMKWESIKTPAKVNKKTILIIPGFCGGDLSVLPLKKFLCSQGHNAYSWGLGFNHGRVEEFIDPLVALIKRLSNKHGESVSLVGWSLGGIISRELARFEPENIASVLTMGSPVIGGPKFTALNKLSSVFGWKPEEIEQDMIDRYATPIECPISAIYSKLDGIVSWEACIDHWSPNVSNHEVSSSHFGMGYNKRVYEIISQTLAK